MNDDNYDGVFRAVLGAAYPRRLRGCAECAMEQSSDDEDDAGDG
jgi:hypothetical protein